MTELLEKQTVLIVDDDSTNIRILTDLLRTEYATVVARDGNTALRIAMSDTPPDLILLDVMMPQIDGYQVCKKLQSNNQTKKIPIIFITARDSEEDEIKGFEAGAVDYITKPFRIVIVKARVQTHVELKRQRDLLENLSFRDGLTGIPNRRRFDEYLLNVGGFAIRECSPLSLIMVDIDYFKAFNDYYGHYEGDACLIRIAKSISNSIKRTIDLVARYGGEEFVCILPRTKPEFALMLAEKIRESVLALQIPHVASPVNSFVTVSVGVATSTLISIDNNRFSENLITATDKMLYLAKEQGRNRVQGIELSDIAVK